MATLKAANNKTPPLANMRSRSPNLFADIQKILVSHGAREFSFELNADGEYVALTFSLMNAGGQILKFRMPANVQKVRKILFDEARTNAQQNASFKQGYQTAWANVRDWLRVQFTLHRYHQVETAQVFLPYMVVDNGHTTLYDVMVDQMFHIENSDAPIQLGPVKVKTE